MQLCQKLQSANCVITTAPNYFTLPHSPFVLKITSSIKMWNFRLLSCEWTILTVTGAILLIIARTVRLHVYEWWCCTFMPDGPAIFAAALVGTHSVSFPSMKVASLKSVRQSIFHHSVSLSLIPASFVQLWCDSPFQSWLNSQVLPSNIIPWELHALILWSHPITWASWHVIINRAFSPTTQQISHFPPLPRTFDVTAFSSQSAALAILYAVCTAAEYPKARTFTLIGAACLPNMAAKSWLIGDNCHVYKISLLASFVLKTTAKTVQTQCSSHFATWRCFVFMIASVQQRPSLSALLMSSYRARKPDRIQIQLWKAHFHFTLSERQWFGLARCLSLCRSKQIKQPNHVRQKNWVVLKQPRKVTWGLLYKGSNWCPSF